MRRRTTFIDVYRYRKNRHAVLCCRGASIASHFAMRRSGVRSPSAPPPQAPTLSRQSAYCRSRCRTSLGQLVLQLVLLGHTNGHRPGGNRQPADNPRRALNWAQVDGLGGDGRRQRHGSPSAPDFDSWGRAFESLRVRHFLLRSTCGGVCSAQVERCTACERRSSYYGLCQIGHETGHEAETGYDDEIREKKLPSWSNGSPPLRWSAICKSFIKLPMLLRCASPSAGRNATTAPAYYLKDVSRTA